MSDLQSSASEAQMIDLLSYIKMPIMGAGGGFASIGAECYHEGTTAPEGWLICDGSVLNIADYPDLATYYASHYGASNHFGGDGVTTFAVPIKEGMPENADSVYGEQERIVGVWKETVDGVVKQKPLYQKLLIVPSEEYANSTYSFAHNINNLDFGFIKNATTQYATKITEFLPVINGATDIFGARMGINSTSIQFTVRDSWSGKLFFTLQYTKTTDSWILPTPGHSADGNGVFCVKATVAGDPNAHHYSTEEQIWGQDENGNIIYEKTVTLTSSNFTQEYNEVSHGINNIGELIEIFGSAYRADNNRQPLPKVHPSSKWILGIGDITPTTFTIAKGGGYTGDYALVRGRVTLRYTKTTDQWQTS